MRNRSQVMPPGVRCQVLQHRERAAAGADLLRQGQVARAPVARRWRGTTRLALELRLAGRERLRPPLG